MTSERSAADIHGRDFPAGAVVFEEGDPGRRLHVLVSGQPPDLDAARLLPEGSVGRDSTLASDYVAWLELKRRFEPEGNA